MNFTKGQKVKVWATLGDLYEEYTGTVVATTVEWGTGRRGVSIRVETAPARFLPLVGWDLGFKLDEWNVLPV